MKRYVKMSNNMKEFSELDDKAQDSVKVAMIWGFFCGGCIFILPAICVATLIIYAVTTQ